MTIAVVFLGHILDCSTPGESQDALEALGRAAVSWKMYWMSVHCLAAADLYMNDQGRSKTSSMTNIQRTIRGNSVWEP